MATKQSVTFNFQDGLGNPISNGKVVLQLSVPSAVVLDSGEIAAQRFIKGTLDSDGSVTLSIWPNASILPEDTVYLVRAYTAEGQLVYNSIISISIATPDVLLEESSDPFLLEDGTSFILLETGGPPPS